MRTFNVSTYLNFIYVHMNMGPVVAAMLNILWNTATVYRHYYYVNYIHLVHSVIGTIRCFAPHPTDTQKRCRNCRRRDNQITRARFTEGVLTYRVNVVLLTVYVYKDYIRPLLDYMYVRIHVRVTQDAN